MDDDLEFLSDKEKFALMTPSIREISPVFQWNQKKFALPVFTFNHSRVRQRNSLITINHNQPFLKLKPYAVPEKLTFFND